MTDFNNIIQIAFGSSVADRNVFSHASGLALAESMNKSDDPGSDHVDLLGREHAFANETGICGIRRPWRHVPGLRDGSDCPGFAAYIVVRQ
jgi:hypothetical protein